jgi:hypothetical protein
MLTARARHEGDGLSSTGMSRLAELTADVVDREAETMLLGHMAVLWGNGWQPAELHRQGRLACSAAHGARLLALAIASDHARRRASSLDRRWTRQVEGLDLPAVNGRPGWLGRWISDEGLDRSKAIASVADVLANVLFLPRLDPVLPPPGFNGSSAGATSFRPDGAVGAETDPVLVRIRNLLAKGESSTFEAEAIAFTAKAQELMTRHAIDAAVVNDRSRLANERPIAIRVAIDSPYADAKSLLLQTVAEAGRCRSIFHFTLAMSTVVGFDRDVSGVEMLFTSLLVQAQTALAGAATLAPPGTRTRSQSYRSAFLLAYTGRIGERLREINDAVYAAVQAEQGSAFLPVLRSRSDAIDDFMTDRFGDIVSSPVRGGYDAAGWANGRFAADNARVALGDLVPASGEG